MPPFDLRWILFGLLALLLIGSMWRANSGAADPSWTKCKESLAVQMFTGNCTLRYEGEQTPA